MKKLIKWFTIYFLFVTTLVSCSNQPNTNVSALEKQFSTVIPVTDMNKSLHIAVDSNETFFSPSSEIDLIVHNESPYSLYFDNDSHMRLLGSLDNIQWVEVKNGITYSATMLLSPKGTTLLDTQYTSVKPIFDESNLNTRESEILLRIVMVGEIMEGDTRTGKNVGAYVDVILKP